MCSTVFFWRRSRRPSPAIRTNRAASSRCSTRDLGRASGSRTTTRSPTLPTGRGCGRTSGRASPWMASGTCRGGWNGWPRGPPASAGSRCRSRFPSSRTTRRAPKSSPSGHSRSFRDEGQAPRRLRRPLRLDPGGVGTGAARHLAGSRARRRRHAARLRFQRRRRLRRRAQALLVPAAGGSRLHLRRPRHGARQQARVQARGSGRPQRLAVPRGRIRLARGVAIPADREQPDRLRLGTGGERSHAPGRRDRVRDYGAAGGEGHALDRQPVPRGSQLSLDAGRPGVERVAGARAPVRRRSCGETSWRSEPSDEPQWFLVDFGEPREYGGLIVRWDPTTTARPFDLESSDDGTAWKTLHSARRPGASRSYIYLPHGTSRRLRLRLHQGVDGKGIGIAEIDVRPYEFSRSLDAFFQSIAANEPRGPFPRYLCGEQTYWTSVGSAHGGATQGLLNEDGMLEVDRGTFSIEPFLYVGEELVTWADCAPTQELEQG